MAQSVVPFSSTMIRAEEPSACLTDWDVITVVAGVSYVVDSPTDYNDPHGLLSINMSV